MTDTPPNAAAASDSRRGKRCVWSGVETAELEAVEAPSVDRLGRPAGPKVYWVRPSDRAAFLSFNSLQVQWGRWFLPGLALIIAVMVAASWFAGERGLGTGLMVLGIYLNSLPFATPETVEMLGIRRSVLLARGIAIGLFGAGAFFHFAAPGR